jgi:hypothetical protein
MREAWDNLSNGHTTCCEHRYAYDMGCCRHFATKQRQRGSCWQPAGNLLANCWQTAGKLLANCAVELCLCRRPL